MKSRMLVSFLIIAVVASLIGGATMAWFTDSAESEPVTFQAGTLLVDIDNFNTGNVDFEFDCLNPGDQWEYTFDVVNSGTKNLIFIGALAYKEMVGYTNGSLGYDQTALLYSKGNGTSKLSEIINFNLEVTAGPWTGTVYDGPLAEYDNASNPMYPPATWPAVIWPGTHNEEPLTDTQYPIIWFGEAGPLAPGEKVSFKATCTLPEEAGNEYQGSKLTGAFSILARQNHAEAGYPALKAPMLTNYPSSNIQNQNKEAPRRVGQEAPYVELVEWNGDQVTLKFVNQTGINAGFEVRVDNEDPGTTDHWGNMYPWINADEKAYVTIYPNAGSYTFEQSYDVVEKVEVRQAFGAERDFYFDWITFYKP